MILETERLILRPWKETDAEDLYEYAKDPAVGPAAGWPPHRDAENSRAVIRNVLAADETYAVCLREDGRAIGSIGLMIGGNSNLGLPETEGEIGYWIGVPFWGRGLIPEAARELIRRAFADLRLQTLWCGYFDGNERSKRVQEKCGFVYHHTDKDVYWKPTDDVRTEHVTRLTREEWKDSFTVRTLTEDEIPAALDLARRVFEEYESPVYPPEGTEEFRKCLHDDVYLAGMLYYGAFDRERLIGILGIRGETRHVCFFFVEGKYHRLGVGTKLFRAMRADHAGYDITLNSSPYGTSFYHALGFTDVSGEQTVSGIRFTPMILKGEKAGYTVVKLSQRRDLKEQAAAWFASRWNVPEKAYLDSIERSFTSVVPSWYLCLSGGRIVGGLGVIENDFHDRKDLTPNVCAVYTEPDHRGRGIAGRLLDYACEDMRAGGIDTLYLLTDHDGFYERYGWKFLCTAQGDGEEKPSRMYVHVSRP